MTTATSACEGYTAPFCRLADTGFPLEAVPVVAVVLLGLGFVLRRLSRV